MPIDFGTGCHCCEKTIFFFPASIQPFTNITTSLYIIPHEGNMHVSDDPHDYYLINFKELKLSGLETATWKGSFFSFKV